MDQAYLHEFDVVTSVLPFRVNNYVVDSLIDWHRPREDPIFNLTFPHRRMLQPEHFDLVASALGSGDRLSVEHAVAKVRDELNPHPAGQLDANVPQLDGVPLEGLQHKYRETVLVFPAQAQSCHAYCSYCFRWPQFTGEPQRKIKTASPDMLTAYLRAHPEVTDVLLTGGDPFLMRTHVLLRWIRAVSAADGPHPRTIRIGTKAPAYWPQRFLTDPDAAELLQELCRLVDNGHHVAVMAHYSHPRELETAAARAAVRALQRAGVTIRSQAPVVAHVNDDPAVWAALWQRQVDLGISPYYMFVERDTGAKRYFALPLARAFGIYVDAIRQVSGLARTARGPMMSTYHGKILISGVSRIGRGRAFICSLLQARDPQLVGSTFLARYDESATWIDDLRPVAGTTWPWLGADRRDPSFGALAS
ncbi:4Fe-4S cluster-binding domain-containing protein [Dactylosporangium sp. NPDC000555]|uniref:KamA family radical SAM protein n=1 Tax=Dactylosporangium sp. NPDC000555 TaxID=3154260 RepID=UPI003328AF04